MADLIARAQQLVDDPEIKRLGLDKFVAIVVMLHTGATVNEVAAHQRIRAVEDRLAQLERWMTAEAEELARRACDVHREN